MAYLVDSHAHLVDKVYKGDRQQVIQRALQGGVKLIINLGYDLQTSSSALEMAEQYPFMYAAAGIHPHGAKNVKTGYLEDIKGLASREKAVAVGEIGLDFYRDLSPRHRQEEVFREQLRLARILKLPVIIHDREAHQEVLDIVEEEEGGQFGGVFHCFSGDWKMAEKCLELGFYISIAGPVTYKKSATLREVARRLPLDRVLVETDCPYLTPVPFRGKRNEPAYVRFTVEEIATLRNMQWEELAGFIYDNTRRLFNIKDI